MLWMLGTDATRKRIKAVYLAITRIKILNQLSNLWRCLGTSCKQLLSRTIMEIYISLSQKLPVYQCWLHGFYFIKKCMLKTYKCQRQEKHMQQINAKQKGKMHILQCIVSCIIIDNVSYSL